MQDETELLVIAHLREVHAELKGINDKLEDHDRRLDRVEKRLEDLRAGVDHARSLAMLNQTTMRQLEAGHEATGAWQKRIDDRLDKIEGRLMRP
ncbi:MAG TPA: hypothetical protein VFZ16_08095 [Hyphomicrobiaceae bacterium]|nr:hypothetical protein [Hyphomicrobiaceae bacterium]